MKPPTKILASGFFLLLAIISAPIVMFICFSVIMMTLYFYSNFIHSASMTFVQAIKPLVGIGMVCIGTISSITLLVKYFKHHTINKDDYWYIIPAVIGAIIGIYIEYNIRHNPNDVFNLFYGELEIPSFSILFYLSSNKAFSDHLYSTSSNA